MRTWLVKVIRARLTCLDLMMTDIKIYGQYAFTRHRRYKIRIASPSRR